MKQLLIAAYSLVLALSTEASELVGKVVSVSDGDTLRVLVDDQQIKIRLGGIDAPESDQPFGQASKRYLAEAVAGQTVVVGFEKKDRYGRLVGTLYTPEGVNVNLELVCNGSAWWYERYAPNSELLESCQEEAQDAPKGLWKSDDPMPPWEWRRR